MVDQEGALAFQQLLGTPPIAEDLRGQSVQPNIRRVSMEIAIGKIGQ